MPNGYDWSRVVVVVGFSAILSVAVVYALDSVVPIGWEAATILFVVAFLIMAVVLTDIVERLT